METLEELKSRNRELRIRNEVRSDFLNRDMERNRLKTENRKLSRPRTSGAFTQIRSIIGCGAKSIGSGLKKEVKKQLVIGRKESITKIRTPAKKKGKSRRKKR